MTSLFASALFAIGLAATAFTGTTTAHARASSGGIGTATSCYECGSKSTCEKTTSSSMSCRDSKSAGGLQTCEVYYPDDDAACSKGAAGGLTGFVLIIW